jgi:hypothetical protein
MVSPADLRSLLTVSRSFAVFMFEEVIKNEALDSMQLRVGSFDMPGVGKSFPTRLAHSVGEAAHPLFPAVTRLVLPR